MKDIKVHARIEADRTYPMSDDDSPNYNGFLKGFVAGLDFAQRWISTEEKLPKNEDVVLLKIMFKGSCFIDVGYFDITDKIFYSTTDITVKYPTHWRPIEYK